MSKRFEAKIYWLPESEGGRREIPTGEKYAPIIVLNPSEKSGDFWSAFVINKLVLNTNETLSDIEYLSNKAPDNLASGVEFVLSEGSKLVANGVILRETE